MIIGMKAVESNESYCNQCETWSNDDAWKNVFEVDGDDNPTVDAVECPNCGHWHPPYDPPMREAP
jgi:adenine-specific DNA methylase